ncbi:MAG: hypothetical protein IKX30_04590 [Victivallales bacterium]|nr:hypothetical protein [Victivallales bacterium]
MAEEENKQEQPQMTEAVETTKTAEKTDETKTSGWRYAGIWLAICLGTALALVVLGQFKPLLTPLMPLALTMGGISCIGMSSISVWGLIFTIPMGFLCSHWLKGGVWWRLLPAIMFLQGILASLNLAFMDDGTDASVFKSGAKEMSEAEISRLAEVASARWAEGGLAAGICLCLLIIHICICGPKKTWNAVRDQWNSMRAWLKKMRDASKAEEEAKKAESSKPKA